MAYWHEIPQNENFWLFQPKRGSRVTVYFRGQDVRKAPFQGFFMRFERPGEIPTKSFSPWRQDPEGWFVLSPLEPMLASSMEEAKAFFQPLLPQIEDGSLDALFERKPYQRPISPQPIKEIAHPAYVAKARIVQHANGIYQIGYVVYDPNDRYLPVSTPSISTDPDFEWGVAYVEDEEGQRLKTMADDLASAEAIAVIELDRLVTQDSDIPRRQHLSEPT